MSDRKINAAGTNQSEKSAKYERGMELIGRYKTDASLSHQDNEMKIQNMNNLKNIGSNMGKNSFIFKETPRAIPACV